MSVGRGFDAKLAIGAESTFGTAVAVSELIPFTSESVTKEFDQQSAEYLDGNPAKKDLKNVNIKVGGDISGEMVYDEIAGAAIGIERLLRGALGNSARDTTNGLNKYYPANDLDDYFTLAFNKQVSLWEIVSAKFGTLEIFGKAGEKMMFSLSNLIARDLLRTGDSGIVNSISGVEAISPTNIPANIMFDDGTFRIGDTSDALTSSDEKCIDGFTLTINNNLSDAEYTTPCSTNDDAQKTIEPLRNGWRELEVKLEIPRYESDQYFTWLNNETALQLDFKFALGSYQFNILLPYLKVKAVEAPIGGPEIIKQTVTLVPLRNAGRNTYMTFQDSTAISDEIGIEMKSARTSVV